MPVINVGVLIETYTHVTYRIQNIYANDLVDKIVYITTPWNNNTYIVYLYLRSVSFLLE
jgi:hypothetical protein